MSFAEFKTATDFKSVLVSMIDRRIDRLRPRPKFGRVVAIDRGARKCQVTMNGDPDDTFITVPMGTIQPAEVGQFVRVEGIFGNRFITDVLGPGVISAQDMIVSGQGGLDGVSTAQRPALVLSDGQSVTMSNNSLVYMPLNQSPALHDTDLLTITDSLSVQVERSGWWEISGILFINWPGSVSNRQIFIEMVNQETLTREYFCQVAGPASSNSYQPFGPRRFFIRAGEAIRIRARQVGSSGTNIPGNIYSFEMTWFRDTHEPDPELEEDDPVDPIS